MTVHGAKNREFDYVFILWPFNVPSVSLQKRKLLYNAVTRARLGATLFVQGDEKRIRGDDVLNLLACGLVASRASKKSPKKPSR
jgi:superfamily I DNA/RNA helicase